MSERPHVLIVDDDREIRGLLAQYLEKHDFRTTAVADGREMRRILERSHVDLLVLDLMLPGEDGLSLCRELRSRSQLPIIMLTARGEDVDASEYTFRAWTQIETAAAELDCLIKGIFIAVGGRQAGGVTYETYLVS